MASRISFVDLAAHHRPIRAELDAAWARVVEAGAFILGEELARFETAFAGYLGAGEAVGVATGLDALTLALCGLGIGEGDEVLVPANTFIATALAVSANGARPVLVDCDPLEALMDPAAAAAVVTPRTRAVIPVHLYGRPCPPGVWAPLASRHNLAVIEDAGQAHGARFGTRRCGTLGHAGTFSFYPGKNLGAFGDGGCLVTSDAALARRVRQLRSYGEREKYHHEVAGGNSRLDALQAAVLSVKLARLDAANAERRRWAARYDALLAPLAPDVLPLAPPVDGTGHVYHLYVIRVAEGRRDALRRHLSERGIDTGIHYPVPIHLQPAYESLGYREGDFPIAEALAGEILSLPMYPELGAAAVDQVAETIAEFLHAAPGAASTRAVLAEVR